jgi:hypothetical protein
MCINFVQNFKLGNQKILLGTPGGVFDFLEDVPAVNHMMDWDPFIFIAWMSGPAGPLDMAYMWTSEYVGHGTVN